MTRTEKQLASALADRYPRPSSRLILPRRVTSLGVRKTGYRLQLD